MQNPFDPAKRFEGEFVRFRELWPAPQKLVQPIRETPGRLAHGGTHEKAMDRRPDYAIAQGS
jgi:hypothetical protein